jgi:hypothetical protein
MLYPQEKEMEGSDLVQAVEEFDFEVDVQAEDDGVWVPMSEVQPNFEIKLRSIRSDAYRKAQTKKFSKLRALGRLSTARLTDESERITRECISEACILDWKGLKNKSGVEVPYSPEQAKSFMTERRFAMVAEAITVAVRGVGMVEEAEEEKVKGN